VTSHATYLARVESDNAIRIYADDWERPAATIELPPNADLRETLARAGWRPTGRRPPSGVRGAVYVEPVTPRR
jgi:hypothetical protein